MTETDLTKIEVQLTVSLPKAYRELIVSRVAELSEAGCFDDEFSMFYLNPSKVISVNELERQKDSGTGHAFPQWWKSFFLVGTNGGGDFYCLRLDDEPGVWMIGSDCGDEPTRVARSLTAFVEDRMKEHAAEKARVARRRELFEGEFEEEMRAVAEAANPMAEKWLTALGAYPMFQYLDSLGRKVSPRKLRLFGLACCRGIATLADDDDCGRAVELAEQLVDGMAAGAEVARLRERLKEKYLAICNGVESSAAGLWCVGATKNLLQDDDDYLREAPIYAGDADLLQVWSSAESAGSKTGDLTTADLLREVLGNPFHPVQIEPDWRTQDVLELARTIYEDQQFDRMPVLADVMESAGCHNQRILKHCRRKAEHIRGCWVLDLILEKEPELLDSKFTWDFDWQHPTIDPDKLKQRLKVFGIDAPGDEKRVDDRAALNFADWLEENGDIVWAKYVRVRCVLDGQVPTESHPDLIEQRLEIGAAMRPGRCTFEGFYFGGTQFAKDGWWGHGTDDLELGLPSMVNAVKPGAGQGPVGDLVKRMDALVQNTPVRGVNLEGHYRDDLREILDSASARHLRRLSFANKNNKEQTGSQIDALVNSPCLETLERLSIDRGVRSEGDANALASASFKQLRRLEVGGISCPAKIAERLMAAPWFRQLHHLEAEFSEKCCETAMQHLSGMPNLHSLVMWKTSDRQILALKQAGEFPALRRLGIYCADLSGKNHEAIGRMQVPELSELWLKYDKATVAAMRNLGAAPLFDNLRVLTLAGSKSTKAILEAVAARECAGNLRILRLHCGNHDLVGNLRSLADTPLTNPGTFPELTTLQIKYPYSKKAKRDTAEFLKKLATPRLRHLTLNDCDFDDECASALVNNPVFANLTRLTIDQGHHATEMLCPEAAETMFRSANLQNLVELELHNFNLHTSLLALIDTSVMPNLGAGNLWGTGIPHEAMEKIHQARPVIYVGS